jgi:signal transduction histidine kinase/CheY-like chemotaxis protein/HPt (histidine-containing phosphotransfer) domain-containing protein
LQFASLGQGAAIGKTLELAALRKGGTEFPIEISLNSIEQDDGWWAVAVLRDITERKRTEQQIQDYAATLESNNLALEEFIQTAEAANLAKSQFLASISHELRTPLTGILGFTDLLLDSDTDEEERRNYLQIIHSSGHHLLELINNILDLSKIEAAQIDVELAPCTPHGILSDVVSIMRAQAQAKGLDLRCRWSGSVPGVVNTDGARLRQILLNLVGNAVKFTQQGVVEVVARLEPYEGGHKLMVDVSDSGIGIPEEKLDSIFEPFIQADNSVTRKFGGSGLGLAISVRLARALGGDITVTSELGVGSTFTVSIDAGDLEGVQMLASPPADGMQTGQDATPSCDVPQFRPGNVLLIEDGYINRKLISTVLEQAGLSVSAAENGEVGVELATSNHFDLILMDMQMPVMDGYAATRKLRNMGYTTPIIALTAHAMKGDEDKCLAAGCSHYVSKPIAIDTLLATVADALGREDAKKGTGPICAKHPSGRPGKLDPSPFSPAAPPGDGLKPLVSSLPTEEPVFHEIAHEFVEYLDQLLAEMRQAAAKKDVTRLAEMAHSLKGSAGTAGFGAFTEPARQLETLAKRRRLDAIDPAIDELAKLVGRILVPTEPCDAEL